MRSCHSSAVKDRALCLPCGTGHGRDVSGNRTNSTIEESTTRWAKSEAEGLTAQWDPRPYVVEGGTREHVSPSADRLNLEPSTALQRSADRHFVSPLQVASHWEASGQTSHAHAIS